MRACFECGINPEDSDAPRSMTNAVRDFFKVREGRIGTLSAPEQTQLAQNIHLVAVGERNRPSYLIIDRGEGQTPARSPETLVSLNRENKMRIPFVQGKFNAGGTAVLQFCGKRNYQLIISRRSPTCPVKPGDQTAGKWGFTLVRRVLPSGGRRSSEYTYLAPGGNVPTFVAPSIRVLPGTSAPNRPPQPYAEELEHGTVIKLYEYRWRAKSTATTEARYELERYILSPALPFRITETRNYTAHFYSTTLSGAWAGVESGKGTDDGAKVENGFPGDGVLVLPSVGELPYQLAVYKEDVKTRHVPHGVFFTLDGRVQGDLPADFVTRKLKFDHLSGHLLVAVDCTGMNERVREDFFMASRDRVRRDEVYHEIVDHLASELREHPGLRALNAQRRRNQLDKALNDEKGTIEFFQDLINKDPALAGLFSGGDRLVVSAEPGEAAPFKGQKFPRYFRLSYEPRGGLVKIIPVNRTARVEFETDAENYYFRRADSPGSYHVDPDVMASERLWDGHWNLRVRPPADAKPGDIVPVEVTITDVERDVHGGPFVCRFTLAVDEPAVDEPLKEPGPVREPRRPHPKGKTSPVLAMPNIIEVHREQWTDRQPPFDEVTALRITHGEGGGYDFWVNMDNAFLLTELTRSRRSDDAPLIRHWFKYGLALCAMGMMQNVNQRKVVNVNANGARANGASAGSDEDAENPDTAGRFCDGLARVIVPIIRHLHDTAVAATV